MDRATGRIAFCLQGLNAPVQRLEVPNVARGSPTLAAGPPSLVTFFVTLPLLRHFLREVQSYSCRPSRRYAIQPRILPNRIMTSQTVLSPPETCRSGR